MSAHLCPTTVRLWSDMGKLIFVRPMSDDRLLFAALIGLTANFDDYN